LRRGFGTCEQGTDIVKTTSLLRLAAAHGALAIAAFATPAFAQGPQAACIDADADGTCDDAPGVSSGASIVVTGSRIRQPNLESASPVTVITGDQLFETGSVSIGDQLNDLPQLRSTFSQANSTRFLGTRGLSLLDLRGLGTQRTLVLVNGRRHVAADVLSNGVSVDINTIPADLVLRTDVVTGGASAVYGSDAIAGVVNFILREDYDGIKVRGQAGISEYKDAGNQFVSLLAGKNFADGRGNITAALEFAHTSAFFASGRPNLRQNNAFVITENDPAGVTNGSNGNPDRTFYRDIRSTTLSLGGLVSIRNANAGAPCGVDAFGAAFTCLTLFNPDGTLVPVTGQRVGVGPNGSLLGGNSTSSREGRLLTLTPDLKRYSANLLGHFEFTPAAVAFFEAKYVRSEAVGSQSGPFFSQGTTLGDSVRVTGFEDRSFASPTGTLVTVGALTGSANAFNVNREGIRLDNPYLSSAARATIAAQSLTALNANINPNTGAAFATTGANAAVAQANRAALIQQVNNGTFRFALRRNYLDLGIRDENFVRETYRIVGGLRGEFNGDWTYEISGNYGEHREHNTIIGNVNRQRFLLANDTARNAAGQIVCRAQVDPNYFGADRGGVPATLAADVAACVPLNPFGEGSVTQAAKNYLLINSTATGKITQTAGLAFVSGDLSQLFELPGGPVAFSLGAEYRRETLDYDLDDVTQAGYAFYNAIPSFTSPAFEVKEAYGEIRIPLIRDSFIHELSIKGAGRISDYKGATGTVYTYGGEGIFSPVKDITFRGAYNRSVRAPTLSDLFSAQGQNFAPGFTDPCSARNLATGSANRVANCNAAGRPATYDFVYSSSLETVSGGNPGLREETSDSYTAGFILQPRWIPGLSISADYYDIQVNNVIAATGTPQTIVNLCYDSASLSNPFCGLFQRAGASGGPRGEQEFRILEGSLI
ncbi:MAG: TonB-dependent receptor, partial [Variovorax sp.]|nr:TonB-dependent receptor [Variovorax sp.]